MSKADQRRRERRAQQLRENAPVPTQYRASSAPLRPEDPGRDTATWLICGYLTFIVAAYVAILRLDVMLPGSNSRDRVFFLATNAGTLTGFPLDLSYRDTLAGPLIFFCLTLAGALVSLIVGGMAAVRILGLPYSDRQVRRAAYLWIAASILAGVFAQMPRGWHDNNLDIFSAFLRTLCAFSNSGIYFGKLPGIQSWQTQVLLMPLSILGGFGLPVLMELVDWVRTRRPLSRHSLTVLSLSAALYLIAFLIFAVLQAPTATWHSWRTVVASSSVAAVNSRTAGFPFQLVLEYPRVMQWLLVVLMFIGASPAGTGGGLKTTTLLELFRGVYRSKTNQPPGRGFAIAATWLGLYVAMAIIVFLLLVWTQSDPSDRLFFMTISALSNVGLAHDKLSTVGPGLFILSAAMLFGRITPLLILWWMATSTTKEELAVG